MSNRSRKRIKSFTHEPESHACKGVNEWLSVQGFVPPKERNPETKEATAARRWSFTPLEKATDEVERSSLAGFTLVEIMIVVGLIVLLAAMMVPNVLRGRITANESSAIVSLKAISTAAQNYMNDNSRYPVNLIALRETNPSYLNDAQLGCSSQPCLKNGYSFSLEGSGYTFEARATPQNFQFTGIRSFYVNESGTVKYCDREACDPSQGASLYIQL